MSAYPIDARPPCPGGSPKCQGFLTRRESQVCRFCADWRKSGHAPIAAPAAPPAQMEFDRERKRLNAELTRTKALYQESLKTIEGQARDLHALGVLASGLATYTIPVKHGSGTSEATPFIIASDWHSEEIVTLAQTNGLNQANPEIIDARATRFFQSSLRLIRLLNQDVKINTAVLALLGDFITNDLHEEAAETNDKRPIHAIIHAQQLIASGIEFLLNNSPYTFVVPCKVGNHSRTTKKVRFSVENGHSLEHLMYVNLAAYFRHEPRVTFLIDEGYHQYFDVYGTTVRLHHGHAIQYWGGIGGLTIPANKAIAAWNRGRPAALDVFGHFHQYSDPGKYVCNGSLIGYNSFAVSIKAEYEPPRQALFLMDKRRGKTCVWPILVDEVK